MQVFTVDHFSRNNFRSEIKPVSDFIKVCTKTKQNRKLFKNDE